MSNGARKIEAPQDSPIDYVEKGIRALASLCPATAMIGELITPLAEKRKDRWMKEVSDVVNSLVSKGVFSFDDLRQDEEFVSLVYETARIAIKTHKKEKLEALKGALHNSLTKTQSDETLRSVFLNFVDQFTPYHISFLKVLVNKEKTILDRGLNYQRLANARFSEFYAAIFPELPDNAITSIWRDLFFNGLVDGENPGTLLPVVKNIDPQITQFGSSFLSFISVGGESGR